MHIAKGFTDNWLQPTGAQENLVRQNAGCKRFTPRRQYRKNPHLRSTLRMPVRVLWRVLANHFRLDRATAVGLRFQRRHKVPE